MKKNDIRLWKHDRVKRLWQRVTEASFDFPVVYTDGLISRCRNDKNGREPWGMVFCGCLVPLHDAPKRMSAKEAIPYCCEMSFAGCYGRVPSFRWLEMLNKKVADFSSQRVFLGGEVLQNDYYLSDAANHNVGYDVVKMTGVKSRTVYYAGHEDKVRILPVIDLSQLYR